ncbi:MAG: class I SAM-dependent methyltransferase [Gammaproteobacteria bacterium]|nr:class I SAM-dependent methyltransferase [Gammaproteobacteria bacterium]
MTRTEIINWFIKKYRYHSYLEIGAYRKENFDGVNCRYKKCVDPDSSCNANYIMTSDKFFLANKMKWGIVFVDGLHEKHQALRDINNALKAIYNSGTILVHDCCPAHKRYQLPEKKRAQWNGTTWKAFVHLRATRADLQMFTINEDNGIGVIRHGKQDLWPLAKIDWRKFNTHKKSILNLVEFEEINKWLG